MKLIVAAVLFLFLTSTGTALALDGIDLSAPPTEVAEGECSQLVQIKYPFLSCASGEIGLADGDDTWDNTRRIPIGGTWTEGDGYWGPSLNEPGGHADDSDADM